MKLSIEIEDTLFADLSRRAKIANVPVEYLAEVFVHSGLSRPPRLAEIMASVQKEFGESGMTEEELDRLVEEARQEIWDEKQSAAKALA